MVARTKQELLEKAQRRFDETTEVRLQSLTELELTNLNGKWMQRHAEAGDDPRPEVATEQLAVMRAELLALCIVDGEGKRMFELTPDDLATLRTFEKDDLDRWYLVARKHNNMDRKEVDDYEKKLPEATVSN